MGLNIPESEHELRSQLCRPAWVALGLTNDLYSIDKERAAAKVMGEDHVCNAVWVAQHEHGLGEDEAKELCRQKTKENVAEYMRIVRQTCRRTDISKDLRIFVEAIQYILSGNIVWTLGAPRYHPAKTYNPRQLEWMTNGTPRVQGRTQGHGPQQVGLVYTVYRAFQNAVWSVVGAIQTLVRGMPKAAGLKVHPSLRGMANSSS